MSDVTDRVAPPQEAIKVVDWLDYEEIGERCASCGGMGGWFNSGHIFTDPEKYDPETHGKGQRWKDYLESRHPDEHPYVEAIRESVLVHKLRVNGSQHQNTHTPLFSDGTIGTFSFRGWGDLMAAIWSEEEDKDYTYMDFYC